MFRDHFRRSKENKEKLKHEKERIDKMTVFVDSITSGNFENDLELDAEKDYVIVCRTGVRSAQICEFLANQNFKSVANLTGGINEWAKRVDDSLPVY